MRLKGIVKKALILALCAMVMLSLSVSGCTARASYANSDYGFSISFPEAWTPAETGSRIPLLQIVDPAKAVAVQISLTYLSEQKTLEEYTSELSEMLAWK